MHLLRAFDEEAHRLVLGEALERWETIGIRQGERRHGIGVLAVEAQHLAAGDERLEAGTAVQQIGDMRRTGGGWVLGCGGEQVLEVVEYQEERAPAQRGDERVEQRLFGHLAHAERLRDQRQNLIRIRDAREWNEEGAVGEVIERIGGDLQGEASLAGAAGAEQRDEAHVGPSEQPVTEVVALALAPDERGRLWWEIGGPVLEGAQRWEVCRHAFGDELKDAVRTLQVLEAMLAQVLEPGTGRQAIAHQLGGGGGEQHLSAVAEAHQAIGPVERRTEVVVAPPLDLTGVNAHADAEPVPAERGPRFACERGLGLDGSQHGAGWAWESRVLGVADRLEDDAALLAHGVAENGVVAAQRVAVAVAVTLEQAGAALDVREEEGDDATGEVAVTRRGGRRGGLGQRHITASSAVRVRAFVPTYRMAGAMTMASAPKTRKGVGEVAPKARASWPLPIPPAATPSE